MKHILIFSHALELGGVERSLIGLLHALDYSKVHVDLFLMRHAGELMSHIPEQVKLLPELPQYASLAVPMSTVIRKRQFAIALGRAAGKYAAKRYVKKYSITGSGGIGLEYSHKYTRRFMPHIGTREYDLAISFLTPHYFVSEKVRAKKKIAWIHTDYTQLSLDRRSELAMWNRYDHIASISDSVTESFMQVFPELEKKILLIENILPEKLIRSEAQAFIPEDMPLDGSVRLLSIGRYCHAKNFDNVPDICARLLQQGLDVRWYIIGYGPDESLIQQKIEEAGMEGRVILLGKRANPYPYIAACDLYVQPSRYEGKSVTVREAQLLGKPVVITRYATAESQLEDGVDGVIVPMDNAGCTEGIAALIANPQKSRELANFCLNNTPSDPGSTDKLYLF